MSIKSQRHGHGVPVFSLPVQFVGIARLADAGRVPVQGAACSCAASRQPAARRLITSDRRLACLSMMPRRPSKYVSGTSGAPSRNVPHACCRGTDSAAAVESGKPGRQTNRAAELRAGCTRYKAMHCHHPFCGSLKKLVHWVCSPALPNGCSAL